MRITYDPPKREWTLRERGLDFEDAPEVFDGPTLTRLDPRDYEEDRYQTFGYLRGRMVMLVWTLRGVDERRIISMRKCNDREQERLGQRLGRDQARASLGQ